MGRKTKLTVEMQERMIASVRKGNYIHTVCAAAGIDERTYFRWKERGATGEEPYSQFCQALTSAAHEAVENIVAGINKAAEFDWRAGAFLLERKHKTDWGRHGTIDASVSTQRAQDIERRLLKGRELMDYYAEQDRKERKG